LKRINVQPSANGSANKPRLIIIFNRFVIGGQVADTISLAWHLGRDFEILILHGEKEKDELEPGFLLRQYPGLRMKKIRLLRRAVNPVNDVFAFFKVLNIILAFKPDIVHTHGAKSGFIGRLAAYFASVPVIIHTFHGHFFHSYFSKPISLIFKIVEKLIGKVTTCAVALSETQKIELVGRYKILPPCRIKIIPLGLNFPDTVSSSEQRETFRGKYGLQPEDIAIGIVGRIVAVKNHPFFIDVLQRLLSNRTRSPVAFFIIGDGELKPRICEYLEQKNISYNTHSVTDDNRVVLTSWLTDMNETMNGLDIVVLTSLNEGTPMSLLEAQYFKKAVVSTDVGGVKDTLADGITGLMCKYDDTDAFAFKLRQLVDNKDVRIKMGEEGYKFVTAKFNKDSEIAATRELYFSLLKQ
jgi:glycosyltransferase involved in cell wall biosynthesis